jgi:hypothetical protein
MTRLRHPSFPPLRLLVLLRVSLPLFLSLSLSLSVSGQRARPVVDPPLDEVTNEFAQGVGVKCVDLPFSNPNNLIPNACCHPRWQNELRRPGNMPHCFTDSAGHKHYGVSMKAVQQQYGVVDRQGRKINTTAWAYGPG